MPRRPPHVVAAVLLVALGSGCGPGASTPTHRTATAAPTAGTPTATATAAGNVEIRDRVGHGTPELTSDQLQRLAAGHDLDWARQIDRAHAQREIAELLRRFSSSTVRASYQHGAGTVTIYRRPGEIVFELEDVSLWDPLTDGYAALPIPSGVRVLVEIDGAGLVGRAHENSNARRRGGRLTVCTPDGCADITADSEDGPAAGLKPAQVRALRYSTQNALDSLYVSRAGSYIHENEADDVSVFLFAEGAQVTPLGRRWCVLSLEETQADAPANEIDSLIGQGVSQFCWIDDAPDRVFPGDGMVEHGRLIGLTADVPAAVFRPSATVRPARQPRAAGECPPSDRAPDRLPNGRVDAIVFVDPGPDPPPPDPPAEPTRLAPSHVMAVSGDGRGCRRMFTVEEWLDKFAVSPDGTQFAYDRELPPYGEETEFAIRALSGGRFVARHRVSSGPVVAWAPRADVVAMPGGRHVVEVGLDGAARRRLPGTSDAEAFAYSPDGSRMAYATMHKVVIGNLADASRRTVLRTTPDTVPPSVSWSPDGRRVLAATQQEGVHVIRWADGHVDRVLPKTKSVTYGSAVWSTSSDHFYALVDGLPGDGNVGLWRFRADGTGRELVLADVGRIDDHLYAVALPWPS